MSKTIWHNLLCPDLSLAPTTLDDLTYGKSIANVRAIAKSSQEITIPDPKAFRSMTRASIFLSHVCMTAKDALAPFLDHSLFSVGIYCAAENGPIDVASTKKILDQNEPAQFAEHYRKLRNPKMYLKQLPNLVPAQMGISMNLQGPMNVYTHSSAASFHALEQAEWDLHEGVVDAALVCGTHAFDDFLVVYRERASDQRCLAEAAAALLLVKGDKFTNWSERLSPDKQNYFGIADQIVNIVKEKKYVG